jgi:hypothetical protein
MLAVVQDVREWHRKYPQEWQTTRRMVKEKYAIYGGQDMRDRNGVILNGASAVAALLYGKGDFAETIRHAFNFGWDADNNAATAGTIVGVIHGAKWINGQGWDVKDRFRNTSRDNMPENETITSFGDRLIAMAGQVIAENGGHKVTSAGEPAYRIRTQPPAVLERLPDMSRRFAVLASKLKPEIESGIVRGASAKEQARAAYLAICLDMAPGLKQNYPERWQSALSALSGFPKVMQVIFYQSGPAGEPIRRKALAAGLEKPSQQMKFE